MYRYDLEELRHFGIPGMKWGIRKAKEIGSRIAANAKGFANPMYVDRKLSSDPWNPKMNLGQKLRYNMSGYKNRQRLSDLLDRIQGRPKNDDPFRGEREREPGRLRKTVSGVINNVKDKMYNRRLEKIYEKGRKRNKNK
jgi:hypothetical protein